ncbi:hypothetical protein P308_12745 [Pseudomonas piscis]|nr:hypothetical protein P308_12745 [Pseudomonas piscis]
MYPTARFGGRCAPDRSLARSAAVKGTGYVAPECGARHACGGALVGVFDQLAHGVGYRLAHQVGVDLLVAAPIGVLVQLARRQFLQVRSGRLAHQVPRRAKGIGQQPHLGLGQARQRRQVASAVAVLGEEAHQRLGAMIGAHHQAIAQVGQRVLGQHSGPGLDIALGEIRECRRRFQAVELHLTHQAIDAVGDIAGADLIGADEFQGSLGVVFIRLVAIRQAHGDETHPMAGLAHLLHRQLAQAPGHQGIDAAADAQHQAVATGITQDLLDECHAAGNLDRLAASDQLPVDAQFPGDTFLGRMGHVRPPGASWQDRR